MTTAWILLSVAIVFEILATTLLKLSNGLTNLRAGFLMAVSYAICFCCLALALKKIPVSMAYAIWSGVGTAAICTIGIVFFKESFTMTKLVSVVLIIIGVIGLNLQRT